MDGVVAEVWFVVVAASGGDVVASAGVGLLEGGTTEACAVFAGANVIRGAGAVADVAPGPLSMPSAIAAVCEVARIEIPSATHAPIR